MVDFLVSFSVALLSGLGVGSGGLLVVFLTAYRGIEQLAAQGINLLFFLFSSSASTVVNIRRRKLSLKAIIILSIGGVVGAVGGAMLASRLSPDALRRLFGGVLLLGGVPGLLSNVKSLLDRVHKKTSRG